MNASTLTLEVTEMYCCLHQSGGLVIKTGESIKLGTSKLTVDNPLRIDNGGRLSSGSGDLKIDGALTLEGELVQGSGILNLIAGGTVGSTGKLDMSNSELQLGTALNITGTLVANSGSIWQGSLDLTSGTFEASGGGINLNNIITGSNTDFKLSGNTEITSSDNMTFGTLDLGGNRLTLGTGSKGLTLPNTLTMDNVSSAIETKNVNLTLGKALSLTSGSITSTGGTLSFSGGLTLGAEGSLDVTGSTLVAAGDLDLSSGTFASNNSSVLELQAEIVLSTGDQSDFSNINFNGNELTLGSASTHLRLCYDANSVNKWEGSTFDTGDGSLTFICPLRIPSSILKSTGGTITLERGGFVPEESRLSLQDTTLELQGERPLHVFLGSTLELKNTSIETNGIPIAIHDGILEVEGTQDLTGIIPDSNSSPILRLTGDAIVTDNT
ncbi:hypothetical protein N9357_01700, partial [bacterium]|nr:hypothetical protein [bacterium]